MGRLVVRVQPGAKRSGFVGRYGEIAKLAVAAPPVDGAANAEAQRTLARLLGVRRRHVELVVGATSRTKQFEIDGLDDGDIAERVDALIDE